MLLGLGIRLLHAGAAKSTSTTLGLGQFFHLHNGSHVDFFKNQLSNAISYVDRKVFRAKVEQNDTDISAVVGVNNSGADVDSLFDSKTGTGGDPCVGASRTSNANVGLDDATTTSGNRLKVISEVRWELKQIMSTLYYLNQFMPRQNSNASMIHIMCRKDTMSLVPLKTHSKQNARK